MNPESPLTSNPPAQRALAVSVLGVGSAGCNALEPLLGAGLESVRFAALNTDALALSRSNAPLKLPLGVKVTRGLGAGGDPERGRAAAEESLPKFHELIQGSDLVFIATGLGGGTGTGASPVLARAAKETNALVLAVVTLPFECEGGRRRHIAQHGLEQLMLACDGVICMPNETAQRLLDDQTSVMEMFRTTNGLLADGVSGIWRMLTRPGLINIDFSDLCSVLRRRHALCRFATASAAGPNRAREVFERLMANPLLEGGELLTNADALLVSIVGGPGLTMAEINRVMDQINRQCDGVHLVLGAAVDDSLADKLCITVVASRVAPQNRESPGAPSPARAHPPAEDFSSILEPTTSVRPPVRTVPPAPESTPEQVAALTGTGTKRAKGKPGKPQQIALPLEIVSKGRFEKSEPTLRNGEDLDFPTYVRKGIVLN
ncbi:MAG: hypothetical protein FJ386_04120 [Verrucomicrobia bacterium]|nr:hypothetical protein [Verrucomicrobiota bacterium]